MSRTTQRALFADLVFNEEKQPAKVVTIGGVPHYVVPDGNFRRHVEAEHVDRQIVALIQERILAIRDIVTEGVIHLLGEESLFTRPSIEHAIENMDQILETEAVDVDELRTTLWMSGFRATVNVHGDVVHVHIPGLEEEPPD
jgi:hypothetical protein